MDKDTRYDNAAAIDCAQYAALLGTLGAVAPQPAATATALERALLDQVAQLQALCRAGADALSGLRTAIDGEDATAVRRAYVAAAAVQSRLERAGGTD